MTSPTQDWRRSLDRQEASRAAHPAPDEFVLAGMVWDLLPGVFSPGDSPSTAALLGQLVFPVGGDFLEVGCGTGVVAVTAALAGCRSVLALDLAREAVDNARLNATRHGVEACVEVRRSDMFAAIGPTERFDQVFWHSNVVWAPATHVPGSVHELAYVDPGYAAHRAFFDGVGDVVRPGGRVVLGVSSRGDLDRLTTLASEFGHSLVETSCVTQTEGDARIAYALLDVVPSVRSIA